MAFSSKPAARGSILSVRLTAEQDARLAALAASMGISGKAELVRKALDYYMENSRDIPRAATQQRKGSK
jgi:predicted DNA-binding protein